MDFTDILKTELKRTINWDDLNIISVYVKDRELIRNCKDVLIWDRVKEGVVGIFKYGKLESVPIIEDKSMDDNYNYEYLIKQEDK
jgi:hypothetical protein